MTSPSDSLAPDAVAAVPTLRLLKLAEVKRKLGLSHTTIYRWMKENQFPRPISLGEGCVRWKENDLDQWIESKTKAS